MPNGQAWYADIYEKAIYGPMVFREEKLNIVGTVDKLLPRYRILADLYLENTPDDQGFPFHTDFDSIGFMERPEDMLTVWILVTTAKPLRLGMTQAQHQHQRINWRRLEPVILVKQFGALVQGMHEQGTNVRVLRNAHRTIDGVLQQ